MTIPVEFSAADIRVEMAHYDVEVSITGPMGPKGEDGTDGTPGSSGFVAQPEPPADTSVLWLDTDEEPAPGGGGGLDEATADARYVNVDGDSMPGNLTMTEGADVQWVDGDGSYITSDGSGLNLEIHGKESLVLFGDGDSASIGVGSSGIDMSADSIVAWNPITGQTPTAPEHLATKDYVDSKPAGGSTILSGSGAPADALGAVGDYYLDTSGRALYGPKAATVSGPSESVIATAPDFRDQLNGVPAGRSYGLRFRVVSGGQINGLRFWPWATGTTTRMLYLWSDAGAALGSVSITTSAFNTGWVVGTLTTPVVVTGGTFYRVSYDVANTTHLAHSDTPPVSGSASFNSAAAYYGVGLGAFPDQTLASANKFVDVVMGPVQPPIWPVAVYGVPPGGSTGQVLNKTSAVDYAAAWAAGGGSADSDQNILANQIFS